MRRHNTSTPDVEAQWDYRNSSGQSKGRERTRRRRSRSSSRGRRSRSSSSSSSGSSSRSSHSSSSRRSDYGRKRSKSRTPKHSGDKYRGSSTPRSNVDPRYAMKDGVSDHSHGTWYPNQGYGTGQEGYPPQSSHLSSSYPSNVTGNFNYQNQGFGNNYQGYQGYESSSYYQATAADFPQQSDYVANISSCSVQGSNWGDTGGGVLYPDISKPPPSHLSTQPSSAVEQELLQQKRTLAKQREDYIKRKISLNRELSRLKDQKRELLQEHSKDNERILRENAKLQNEILQKLKSIDNVIEMLSGIIGDAATLPEVIKEVMAKEANKKTDKRKHSDSPDSSVKKVSRKTSQSPTPSLSDTKNTGVNLVHYDPELHWCADCDAFPRNMIDYLQHLHSDEHKKATSNTKLDDLPWHKAPYRENSPVFHNDLPNKRIPIRGVQFLKPATAWFCSICKMWLGDMHCATNHLRGSVHSNNYNEFTAQNPHWEVDWITDRMRAYERKCGSESGSHKTGNLSGGADHKGNTALDIASISDQLMQMIANANRQRNDSSEQKSSDSQDSDGPLTSKKSKKSKKKKSKKKKKEEDIVPPAAIVKTSSRGKITINLPPVGGVDSVSPKEKEDIATTLLKNQQVTKKSKQVEDSPDGLYDNINLAIRDAAAVRQKSKSLLPSSLSEYGDMNDEEGLFKKANAYDSPKDMRYGPREPPKKEKPRREERTGYGSSNNYSMQSHKNDKYRYDRNRSEYSSSKERRSEKDRYDYRESRDSKSPRSSKERYSHKDKKGRSHSKSKDSQKSPDAGKQDRESERKPPKMRRDKGSSSPEVAETVFEKRTSESAAKKKDPKKVLPKSKLPFIGRMPILKKKVEIKSDEQPDEEKKKEEKKEVEFNLAEAMAKAEAAAAMVNQQISESDATVPLPKSTLIISKRPRLTEPEVVKKDAVLFKGKPTEDNLTAQDMDIEDDHPKDELHKDFKDALDLLFPEEKKEEDVDETSAASKEVDEAAAATEAAVAAAAVAGYEVHGMMAPPTATPYDMGMYHPPAAPGAPPVPDQGQYMGYYDQSMYMHQAAYMMGGYDPNQGMAPVYPTAMEPNAQYMPQPPHPSAGIPLPPMEMVENSAASSEMVGSNPNEQVSDTEELESIGEDDNKDSKDSSVPKKKNPPSQRMRRHLKKKAEQAAKALEGNQQVEEEQLEPPPPPTIRPFSATVDKSDLAMLGIEEDDITAQNFV